MVELFQKVGANLDLPNYASITAVMAAQARGYHEVASMLLRCMDSKAYLEMKEKEKGTPVKKVIQEIIIIIHLYYNVIFYCID
jgi:ankyrin repeat protein